MDTCVATGSIRQGRTITLDETLPLDDGEVHVSSSTRSTSRPRPCSDVLAEIWAGQRARGHVPPTKEDVDAYIREERASWGD